jgi:hypothetical protein
VLRNHPGFESREKKRSGDAAEQATNDEQIEVVEVLECVDDELKSSSIRDGRLIAGSENSRKSIRQCLPPGCSK